MYTRYRTLGKAVNFLTSYVTTSFFKEEHVRGVTYGLIGLLKPWLTSHVNNFLAYIMKNMNLCFGTSAHIFDFIVKTT